MTDTPSLEDLDAFSALGGSLTGAELLGQVHAAFTRYVIFPSAEAADAVMLYTAATHTQAAWEHATRLVVKSPIKRCGKTRLQEVRPGAGPQGASDHEHLPGRARPVDEPGRPADPDPGRGRHHLGQERPAGRGCRGLERHHQQRPLRGWPYVRWDATARRAEFCPTFAMAIIGGIGNMPDTVEDRAVVISMRRRAPGETSPSGGPAAPCRSCGHCAAVSMSGSACTPPTSPGPNRTCLPRTVPPTCGNRWWRSPMLRAATGRTGRGKPARS